ncbi:MAG: radical SAM family heme chaperone HemW [Paludibacteraceae bacterium]|nr:radical SAM family heme chaperone HemW [Paludibacteraceae bacterium]
MAGIYIHIPLCRSRCVYCDFYSSTFDGNRSELVEAICAELTERRDYLRGATVKTLYFGGGTPSLLRPDELSKIFSAVEANYPCAFEEVTLEANPDDLSDDFLTSLKRFPINRLSIGIQSFHDDDLTLLNRRHTAEEAKAAVRRCQSHGFPNISIDLIYGLPNQTLSAWEDNLRQAIELDVPHISAYHLTYEEGTKIYRMLQKGEVREVDEELSVEMFHLLRSMLQEAGIQQYEISNFARPGYHARHNSSYWDGTPYLGAGPAAHSFDGKDRRWNISNTRRYIEAIRTGEPYYEMEVLDETSSYNDYVITSLRTIAGMDLDVLAERFGEPYYSYCLRQVRPFVGDGVAVVEENHVRLTEKGLFLSDAVMEELMMVENPE